MSADFLKSISKQRYGKLILSTYGWRRIGSSKINGNLSNGTFVLPESSQYVLCRFHRTQRTSSSWKQVDTAPQSAHKDQKSYSQMNGTSSADAAIHQHPPTLPQALVSINSDNSDCKSLESIVKVYHGKNNKKTIFTVL